MVFHLAPEFRSRASDHPTLGYDEFDDQGFPSEDNASEFMTEEGAWLNEDAAYEEEAREYDEGDVMPESPGEYPTGPSYPAYTPQASGGGGGYYTPPPQYYQPPPAALPVGTPEALQTFVAALMACAATQEQATAAVQALSAANQPTAAQWVVTQFQAQAERCKKATEVVVPPPGAPPSVADRRLTVSKAAALLPSSTMSTQAQKPGGTYSQPVAQDTGSKPTTTASPTKPTTVRRPGVVVPPPPRPTTVRRAPIRRRP